MAALCFVFSSSTNEWHDNCPKGFPSWCEFKRDACKLNQIVQAGIIYQIHKPTTQACQACFCCDSYIALLGLLNTKRK